MDYQSLYFYLFNQITDALTQLEQQNFGNTAEILKDAQIQCEEQHLQFDQISD